MLAPRLLAPRSWLSALPLLALGASGLEALLVKLRTERRFP
jgi:hypothetical protein